MTQFLNSRLILGALLALSLCASATTFAADSKEEAEPAKPARSGEELSKTCSACHGAQGVSISPDFPNIAGQYKSYLLHSLKGYRSGERSNAVMQSFVKDLSDQELANLAEFYANQDGLAVLDSND